MTKNPAQIAMYKELSKLRKRIDRDATEFYASMCVVLHRKGFTDEQIEDIIVDVGSLWSDVYNNDINIVQVCLEETGLDIRQDIMRKEDF